MYVVEWDQLQDSFLNGPSAVAIGVFDGVHRGHAELIRRARSAANAERCAVFTFSENPARATRGRAYPGDVTSQEQKLRYLNELGVDTAVVAHFTDYFQQLPGTAFLEAVAQRLSAATIIIGENFRCGRDRDTDAVSARYYLEQHRVRVDIAPPLIDNGALISSTRIREAVRAGEFDTAQRLLGRPYVVDLRHYSVSRNGQEWMVKGVSQVLPPPGSYQARLDSGPAESTVYVNQDYVGVPLDGEERPSQIEFISAGG